jgi:predicted nucleic acid-binding protein
VIAIDSSSLIAYLSGQPGKDTDAVDLALQQGQAVLPPVVLSEIMSEPKLPPDVAALLEQIPLLEITEGYWSRTGILRASLLRKRRKARLADCLIAQSCLDLEVPLITRDRDFRSIASACGLTLLP